MIQKIENSDNYNIVENGEKVGRFSLWMIQDNCASFWNFFVDEKYRKNGYGKKALQDVIAKLKADGVAKLWLYVDKANEIALNLYKSLGFEIIPSDRITSYEMLLIL